MRFFHYILPQLQRPCALTIGIFDGFHIGHKKIILELINTARTHSLKATILTFHNVVSKGLPIVPLKYRLWQLSRLPIDYLILLDMLRFYRMPAEVFIEEVICRHLKAKYICVGKNFKFGKDRSGDVALLQRLASRFNYKVIAIDCVRLDGQLVSTTAIKDALKIADIEKVKLFLGGRPHMLMGVLKEGKSVASKLGFPTINIEFPQDIILPRFGVYGVVVETGGKLYKGMANLGYCPTLPKTKPTLEVHIFNFDNEKIDNVSSEVCVYLLWWERPEQRFKDIKTLTQHIKHDYARITAKFGLC